jgi:hypothetical protein
MIAVFGSSEPVEGDPLYESAREVGSLLAQVGFTVLTGGYGGVMEAASRGAAAAGGRPVGITCSVFTERRPNRFLAEVRTTDHLLERTRMLVELAQGYIVLPGKSGTLAELATVWAMHRAGSLDRRPVVLLGEPWRHLLRHLVRAKMIEPDQFETTRVTDRPAEAVEILRSMRAGAGEV